jgi:hypothetical protein
LALCYVILNKSAGLGPESAWDVIWAVNQPISWRNHRYLPISLRRPDGIRHELETGASRFEPFFRNPPLGPGPLESFETRPSFSQAVAEIERPEEAPGGS